MRCGNGRALHRLAADAQDLRAPLHHRQRGAAAIHRPGEIGPQRIGDLLVGRLGQEEGGKDPGVVDQHVDFRRMGGDFGKGGIDRGRVRNVAANAHRPAAKPFGGGHHLVQRATQQDQPVAIRRQPPRHGEAQPRPAAGDDNGLLPGRSLPLSRAQSGVLPRLFGPPSTATT